jgi:cytidine deaminase
MNEVLKPIKAPELIFGLVAPVGVDLDLVRDSLSSALEAVGYSAHEFRITDLMMDVPTGMPATNDISVESYKERIAYANAVRNRLGNDALSGIAVSAIRTFRASQQDGASSKGKSRANNSQALKSPEEFALEARAYIIRQLKRPEEVDLLRRVYGRQFVLISAYAPLEQRCARIIDRERQRASVSEPEADIEHRARLLIEQDSNEAEEPNGQNVRDAFPLGDVFIDASSRQTTNATVTRFIKLLFGNNWLTPSRDEYAMYIAKSASLRSADLSRQVGAAIFSTSGEIISLGCNEVPKATGGTYWEGDAGDARDFQLGVDANEQQKFEVLVDLVERFQAEGLLAHETDAKPDARMIAKQLMSRNSVASSKLMDIIEFGRIIHAEASALADAARRGQSVRGATLYCTTFPCHLCATNIVAAGVMRVVYIEPYPKSYATVLHKDAISLDGAENKVVFEPFVGVSPYRYRDLFEKKKRKSKDGKALEWKRADKQPLIEVYDAAYTIAEAKVVAHFKGLMAQQFAPPQPLKPARKRKGAGKSAVSHKRARKKRARSTQRRT